MVLKIGLTGGIGSGKTTVAKIFEVLSVPVYYADDAAKKLMNTDENLRQKIKQHFGEDAYNTRGLNRQYLSEIVFNNPEKLALLNSIVHPATIADAAKWIQQQTSPYIIKEAALLFESDAYKQLDFVIGVSAPEALRIQRTIARDGISKEAVMARMSKQMPEKDKMDRCEYRILNDEENLLIPQVIKLHSIFTSKLQKG
ncbi:MAG: dephospho-CoA kinase [Bacteroidetes bacterium]|nr:dephospho-CoA kinase [Bacteroidota bacterium]MBS1756782.1 dephospho-CoA kinase [Bacteroidota bacterium]